jgi:RpiB/LacA/LacB family sugar-phosphate isomerase
MNKKFNLLLPVAGDAQRFKDEGYDAPKPLIMAKDKHIIDWALDSIKIVECNIIFVVRTEHVYTFSLDKILKQKFGEDVQIIQVGEKTDGALNTCLLAEKYINNSLPLIIYTPDVCFSPQLDPDSIDPTLDGMILSFKANSPAHSYLSLDENSLVARTVEKSVISTNAAVGVYYYKKGSDFVKYAQMVIEKNLRTKGEFYICPMYNFLIKDGFRVGHKMVDKMHVLGTPAELEFFERFVLNNFGSKPIGLCSDHSGFDLKEELKNELTKLNIEFIDFGTFTKKDCDYNSFVSQAVKSIRKGVCDHAIGSCCSSNGVNICANKHKNIRSAIVFDPYTAEHSVKHNSANFFAMPSKYMKVNDIRPTIEALMNASFDGGRHMSRMSKTLNNEFL